MKFHAKLKNLNLGPRIPDLGIFKRDFEENYCIFETSPLEFVKVKKIHIKPNLSSLGPKYLLIVYI